MEKAGVVEEATLWRDLLTTNVMGTANTVLALKNKMIERKSGHIALVGSLACYATGFNTPYDASKMAILTLGRTLRIHLKPKGVAVTVILPGFVSTPMLGLVSLCSFLIIVQKVAYVNRLPSA